MTRSGASRITVGRAIRELQNLGLVDRVAGSGTYVRALRARGTSALVWSVDPGFGRNGNFRTDLPRHSQRSRKHRACFALGALRSQCCERHRRRGSCASNTSQRKYPAFSLQPLEYEPDSEKTNRRILQAFKHAKIPVVLLDRRATEAPERDRPDLVGINNRQAAYVATKHLIDLGCRHIGFLSYHGAATTISERLSGYTEALRAHGLRPVVDSSVEASTSRADTLQWSGRHKIHSLDAFVCINDRIAGQLMHLFLQRKIRVPEDIRLVGIDDVSYASLFAGSAHDGSSAYARDRGSCSPGHARSNPNA